MSVTMWRCSEVFSEVHRDITYNSDQLTKHFLLRNLAYYVVVSRQDERVTDKPLIFDPASAGRLTRSQRSSCCRVAEVDGEVADQKMLDYLIKHCVTNEMKQQAAELLGTVWQNLWDVLIGSIVCPGLITNPHCLAEKVDLHVLGWKGLSDSHHQMLEPLHVEEPYQCWITWPWHSMKRHGKLRRAEVQSIRAVEVGGFGERSSLWPARLCTVRARCRHRLLGKFAAQCSQDACQEMRTSQVFFWGSHSKNDHRHQLLMNFTRMKSQRR